MIAPLQGGWLCEPLTPDHDLAGFECEEPEATAYLQDSALSEIQSGGGSTFALVRPGDPRVQGFFTLVSHQVLRADIPRRDRSRGFRRNVPATLLAWIARARECRGLGLGEILLFEAFRRAVDSAALVGSALVVLDARNDRLVEWYRGFSFRPLKDHPRRLYITMPELRKLVTARPERPA